MAQLVLLCLINLLPALSGVGQQPSDPPRTFTISGRVVKSNGRAPGDLLAFVSYVEGDSLKSSGVPLEADGTFAVRGLTPGRYGVAAGPGSEPGGIPPGFEGGVNVEAVVLTDHDVTGLVIRTHPSVSIRGHVRYDAEDAEAERPQINLFAMIVVSDLPVPGMGSSAPVEADGTFVIHNVFGPSVIRSGYSLQGRTGWYPGPILLNGRDITNVPVEFENEPGAELEVVFTQRYTGLIGRVVDQAGLPSPEAYALVFSSDQTLWQPWSTTTNVARTDDNGRFWVTAPPGKYLAVAFPAETFRSMAEAKRDFGALARLATPVEIRENRHGPVELTTRRLPKAREQR